MKKFGFCGLLLFLLCLTGCARPKDTGGYRIYTTNLEHTRLQTETYPAQGAGTEFLGELLERVKSPAAGTANYSIFPEGVEITAQDLTDGQLTLTFNEAYLQLSGQEEMLLRAGLVLTMVQMADVRTVVFHIGNDVLRDASGEPVGAMTGSMFLNNLIGENSYQYASLALYFSNSAGNRIVRETRNIHYSANTTLEKAVMEQLIKGPMNSGLLPILPENVSVLGITVKDNVCTLNLSKEFLDVRGDDTILPEVTVYGIVDTLCDVLRVERVQFQVEGQSNVLYKKTLSLDGPFHRNSELIEVQEEKETAETGGQAAVGL